MTQKRIVDAKQRKAEIMVATLFLVTAAASIAGGVASGFDSEGAKLSGRDISQHGRCRLGSPALVDQQHWHRVHRGVHVSLAVEAR